MAYSGDPKAGAHREPESREPGTGLAESTQAIYHRVSTPDCLYAVETLVRQNAAECNKSGGWRQSAAECGRVRQSAAECGRVRQSAAEYGGGDGGGGGGAPQ
jgi:hypothetical protein